MHQTAVAGSDNRLTRCIRVFEVANEQHKQLAKRQKLFIPRKGASHIGCITDEEMAFTRGLLFSRWVLSMCQEVVVEDTAGGKTTLP